MDAPICEECDLEMHRFGGHDYHNRYVEGWSCDGCGWSEDDEEYLPEPVKTPEPKMEVEISSNGYALYWKANEVGGRTYFSDEVGGEVFVWDTSLVDQSTLLKAIVKENELLTKERIENERTKRQSDTRVG